MKAYVNTKKNDSGEIVSIDFSGPINNDSLRIKGGSSIDIITFVGYEEKQRSKVKVIKDCSFSDLLIEQSIID